MATRSVGRQRYQWGLALLAAVLLVAWLLVDGGQRSDPSPSGADSAISSATTGGDDGTVAGTDPESGLPTVRLGDLPPEAAQIVDLIDRGGPFDEDEDGSTLFAHVDGWTGADTKAAFLAEVGEALHFPDYYGQNFDALADCLRDIGPDVDGAVLLWDGWSTLARADEKAFGIALGVLRSRASAERGVPFSVLLRGEGPDLPGIASLD